MVRRLRYALTGAAVLLVLALITGFVAVGQTGRARDGGGCRPGGAAQHAGATAQRTGVRGNAGIPH